MNAASYNLPNGNVWDGSADGVMEQIDEFAKKHASIFFFATLVLSLVVIFNYAVILAALRKVAAPIMPAVVAAAPERFGALMPSSTVDMQAQQVNGWGESFTTRENAEAGRGASFFAKEAGSNANINIGSSAYKVLSDTKFDCANRNAANADSWAWMSAMSQSEGTEGMKSDKSVDRNLYLAAQGH